MIENNNSGVIKHLSNNSLNSNKFRNRLIGIVIILSAFLLSFSSTFIYNAAVDIQNKTLYQGIYSNVSDDMLSYIQNNVDVFEYGVHRDVGIVKGEKAILDIIYTDDNMMKLSNVSISKGEMPSKDNEIAIEERYLSAVGIDAGIGDTITLSFRNDVSREIQERVFIICGFLDVGNNSTARTRFDSIVAKDFLLSDPFLSTADMAIAVQISNASSYSNDELKAKVKEIGTLAGVRGEDIHINNWNIDSNNASSQTTLAIVAIALVVLFACALVIYNIFYISIMRRINEYGQLRTIGATSKQIRKIVLREGRKLSFKYIPIGIVLGCIASAMISPVKWQMYPSLIYAIISSGITYLTVMVSVKKPARYAASITPIDATRYTHYQWKTNKTERATKKLSAFSLGIMNLARDKKKTILTFTSLSLSGILFISLASIMTAIDANLYARGFFPYGGEYTISLNGDLISSTVSYSDLQVDNPLTEELRQSIVQIDGVDSVETKKYISAFLLDENYQGDTIGIYSMAEQDVDNFQKYLIAGELTGNIKSNEISIVVNQGAAAYENNNLTYEIGDYVNTIIKEGEKRTKITFVVDGVIFNDDSGITFYLPSDVMDSIVSGNCNSAFEIISSQGYSKQVETQLRQLIARDERLSIELLRDITIEIKSAFKMMIIALYTFVAFIAVFAIVNLLNTIITNTIVRKKEIGMLQAVGMDRKKLRTMLQTENLCLTLGSFLISLVIGGIGGYALCNAISNIGGLDYIQYQFPLWQIVSYFLLIIIVQFTITYFLDRSMSKQTVIERLQ
ncbi:ABC transporter permease [Clostridium sp. MSJ-11]|uniref:ABC transporter permease n=1 Tax=Clostridium mobile TaxID=2841512 RepID=A0ABS6EIH9_9CLOT|nr:ABC transporter permease [Clostridium mobile]MBU5484843.1 ABC transporter permease [Clostridium mobile]